MVSFRDNLARGLADRGYEVCFDINSHPCDVVLVIGGTRHLSDLWRVKRHGIRIVQRLDGMNWLHRRRRTGVRHFIRAEYGNFILTFIRNRLADGIVYQSRFAQAWWDRVSGSMPSISRVVYNGVDLTLYTPDGVHNRPEDHFRLLVVEGNLGGGYEVGLETAIELADRIQNANYKPVELFIVGRTRDELKERWASRKGADIRFIGEVPRSDIPEIDRSAHLLYSADLNAACPNSVIEAMACGLPVVAFDTGALSELVRVDAGKVVPYGGDPWRLDPPALDVLAAAAIDVLIDQDRFRPAARSRAEAEFGLEKMVDGYLESLFS
jgi:glycosyltransferase involved in cell wall biosynthesis